MLLDAINNSSLHVEQFTVFSSIQHVLLTQILSLECYEIHYNHEGRTYGVPRGFPNLMENNQTSGSGQTYHNRGRRNAFPTIVLEHEEDDEKIPPFIQVAKHQEVDSEKNGSHIIAISSS